MKLRALSITKKILVAALFTMPVTGALTLIPSEVTAEKGGNSNSANGRGNSANSNRGNNGNDNGNSALRGNANREANSNVGRGAIARELRGLNAANANPTALANASPNSMPGKLYAYQQSVQAATSFGAQAEESKATFMALSAMTEERFLELNPDLDYADTLAASDANYQGLLSAFMNTEADSAIALESLTGGVVLSDAAMNELWTLLNL
jgi:hypothetical protein